jgi:hypothetical protein
MKGRNSVRCNLQRVRRCASLSHYRLIDFYSCALSLSVSTSVVRYWKSEVGSRFPRIRKLMVGFSSDFLKFVKSIPVLLYLAQFGDFQFQVRISNQSVIQHHKRHIYPLDFCDLYSIVYGFIQFQGTMTKQ